MVKRGGRGEALGFAPPAASILAETPPEMPKAPRGGPQDAPDRASDGGGCRLAQLLFHELHVLADLRVVLLHPQLLGGELLVLRRGVEVAGASGRNQLDLLAHLGSLFQEDIWESNGGADGARTRDLRRD